MGLIISRNPLVFPGGQPCYNASHIVADEGARFVGVAAGATVRNLLKGNAATVNGSMAGAFTAAGPAANSTASLSYLTYTAANETPSGLTFAAIYTPSSFANTFQSIFNNDGAITTSAACWFLVGVSTLDPRILIGGSVFVSGIALTTGVPYFIAASHNGISGNFVVTNLNTGSIRSFSAAGSRTFGTPTVSQYQIAGINSANTQLNGALSTVFYSLTYQPLTILREWAQAPWDLWYPQTARRTIFETVRGALSANYVDLAGNLGAVSLYGKLLYGKLLYSRGGAFAPAFVGDFDLIGQANFIGDLAPIVSFVGSLTFRLDLGGDLAPSVTLGGDLTFDLVVGGALTPSVTFGADLTFFVDFVPLVGSFTPSIVLGASSFISGPLWPDAETCPPSLWTEVDCDPVDWRKAEVCNG